MALLTSDVAPGPTLESLERSVADQDRGRWFTPADPWTGAPLEFRMRIAGPDSRVQRAARLEAASARLRLGRPTAADLEREAIYLLSRAVLDVDGLVWKGEAFVAEQEAVEYLLTALPWLREQVDAFAANRANYAPRRATVKEAPDAG